MTKLIDLKENKPILEFVTKAEVDGQLSALADKIAVAVATVGTLSKEINAFIESYNKSMQDQNQTNQEFAKLIMANRNDIEALKNV